MKYFYMPDSVLRAGEQTVKFLSYGSYFGGGEADT